MIIIIIIIKRQSAPSILKPTFTLSSSTCFFHVLLGFPFFLRPSTSKSNALLMTWPSFLLNTWPCQRTLFAMANWSMVSFKPKMNIKSIDIFLSLSCTSHIALTMDLSVLCKIPISQAPCFTFIQYFLPYIALINIPF